VKLDGEGKQSTEDPGPFCFPLAANEDNYQALLADCKVANEGLEDAGACCVHCSSIANCTGFSYISGGENCVEQREHW
jgi:hypothetical protein